MEGLIVNTANDDYTRFEDRMQQPCFYAGPDETPVFEVWFWHRGINRWFVMSAQSDPAMVRHGVVYFHPNDIDGLKRTVKAMGG